MASIWELLADGAPRALATVVRQLRSAPHDAGTMMAVDTGGAVVGNVSAGCVDAEVHALAERVLESGVAELATVGVSDAQALGVGLSCGGAIEAIIRLAPPAALAARLAAAVRADRAAALVTVLGPEELRGRHLVVDSDGVAGSLVDPAADAAAEAAARGFLANPTSESTGVVQFGGYQFLVQWTLPRPSLLVFGAVAYAESIAALARTLGYRVVVCDARPLFATTQRVPSADEVVVDWPHRYLARAEVDGRSVVLSLVHDEKFEVPLLVAALRGPAGFVGALGSRRTHRRRVEALRAAGLADEEINRLRAPVGLDLGARTSQETAVSILAEVIAVTRGRSGSPLSGLAGRIHDRAAS